MRFAALQGSGTNDYINAGKAAADATVKSFAINRKTAPDYGEIAKTGMKTRSAERIAATKAGAQVTEAGIKAVGNVQSVAIVERGKEAVRKASTPNKMAGGIAALGNIGAVAMLSKDNTKGRERPSNTQAKKDLWNKFHEETKAKNAQRDANRTEFKPTTTDSGSPSSADSTITSPQSGGDSGKVTGGDTPWARWSRLIRTGEGTSGESGYNTMFTGAQFSDTSKHPRQINKSNGLASDAAGAYQFLSTTWDGAKNALGLTDFSPASQEKAGKYLAEKRGLNTNTVFTDKNAFLKELDKIAPEWASMPTLKTGTSYYGQGGLSPDEAWRIYSGG